MAEGVRALAGPSQPVYAVTYSMGGVLLRHMMDLRQKGKVALSKIASRICEQAAQGCNAGCHVP